MNYISADEVFSFAYISGTILLNICLVFLFFFGFFFCFFFVVVVVVLCSLQNTLLVYLKQIVVEYLSSSQGDSGLH